jgi:hypothetical protein
VTDVFESPIDKARKSALAAEAADNESWLHWVQLNIRQEDELAIIEPHPLSWTGYGSRAAVGGEGDTSLTHIHDNLPSILV